MTFADVDFSQNEYSRPTLSHFVKTLAPGVMTYDILNTVEDHRKDWPLSKMALDEI